jgi:hypothetical protein
MGNGCRQKILLIRIHEKWLQTKNTTDPNPWEMAADKKYY